MENLSSEFGGSCENICFDTECEANVDLEENCGSSTGIYNPQVTDKLRPTKGQEFPTLDDVLTFYNAYAKEAGFSVRSWSAKKNKGSDEIIRKEYVCYKEGKSSRIADVDKKRRRGTVAEGCNAKLAVLKSKSGCYVVSVFVEGHSHPLATPRKTHLLRSHRNVSAATKSLTQQLSMVNIPSHQQYSFLEVQSGGIENIGCTQRDLYNCEREKRRDMKGHDGDMLFEYLKLEQVKNPSFTFTIETDDEQKITRCFWSDATSRRAYKFYGDVVIFDTTYNTNRYGLIFAPIMGVNNHGQTIIFACAFLNDEYTDSFVWLFNQFLKCMPGPAPKMIITDQDPAMSKAFPLVLPNTFHRYCCWHIIMKFPEKIGAITYGKYKKEFSDCIWKSESPEEFELKWKSLIKEIGLEEHTWLKTLYQIRSRWIPAYVNHIFSADMSSSQRAESGHSFFKKFVSKSNSLVDFMIRFSRGLARQRHEELMANHKDTIEKPKIQIKHDLLVQMVEIYTHEMFYKFQDELCDSFNYSFQFAWENENQRAYQIQRRNVETSRVREILYDKEMDFASCSCKKFDSSGIPCRHVLAYLNKFHDLGKLPEKYILNRWTKSANSETVVDESGLHIVSDKSYILNRSQLIQSFLNVVDKALVCEETSKMCTEGLRSIDEQIDQFLGSRLSTNVSSEKSNRIGGFSTSAHASCNYENSYKEPSQVRAKGCGKRLKGGKEKALVRVKNNKARRCHVCGKVGHDKRNCPDLTNG